MKFLYEYRTSDNVRHDGVVSAASRDAAFSALRAQGIRPSSVKAAPGFFNLLFGRGKRWLAIGFLAVLSVAMALTYFSARQAYQSAERLPETRRQIVGDVAVVEKGIRTGWADVFGTAGERFLASYAVPGQTPALAAVEERELSAAVARQTTVEDGDSFEARQIKAIVSGMKDEIRQYLADGGSYRKYGERLVKRQRLEVDYYERACRELEMAVKSKMSVKELEALWEKRNGELRKLGIRLVPAPEIAGFFSL